MRIGPLHLEHVWIYGEILLLWTALKEAKKLRFDETKLLTVSDD